MGNAFQNVVHALQFSPIYVLRATQIEKIHPIVSAKQD